MYEKKLYKTHISHVFYPKRNKCAISFFTIGSSGKKKYRNISSIGHISKYTTIQRKLDFDASAGDNIKNEAGKIFFKKYKDGIFSSDFTGCIMAVFHFNEVVDQNIIENINDLTDGIRIQEPFAAHVYASGSAGDMKSYFASLANSGKITIESMYKPQGKEMQTGRAPAIGEIKRSPDGQWIANTYDEIVTTVGPAQYEVSKGECLKEYDAEQLQAETYKMKGFIGCVIEGLQDENYKEGLTICGQDGRVIKQEYFEILSQECKNAYMEGLLLCGQGGNIIKKEKFQILCQECRHVYKDGLKQYGVNGGFISNSELQKLSKGSKAEYKSGLRMCGANSPESLSLENFGLLSKGSRKEFIKGAKLYKGKLPDWIIEIITSC